jgi:Flp pilus assembly protein TadB
MVQEILNLATGPAGSVVVLLLVLFAVWKMATAYLFPLLREYISNQQQNFRDILEAHKEDRKVFTSAIESLMERQNKVEDDLSDIKTDIKQIKDRM